MSQYGSDTESRYSGSRYSGSRNSGSRYSDSKYSTATSRYRSRSRARDDYDDTDSSSGNGSNHALPLLRVQRDAYDDEELRLEPDLMVLEQVLETCQDKKISVIAITGASRSGRSFLLNTILDQLQQMETKSRRKHKSRNKVYNGFEFKPGKEKVTKGILIWNQAFFVPGQDDDIAVLVMDVEGFSDESSKPNEIEALLTLPLLISSTLIFNTSGDLSPSQFAWIAPLLERGSEENLPKVSFLIRDWTDIHNYPYGNKNSKEYLEDISQSYFTRGRGVPKNTDCFMMPHIGKAGISKKFNGREEDICPEFTGCLEEYLDSILAYRYLKPKHVHHNAISATEFRFFFEKYVDMVNFHVENQNSLANVPIWSFLDKVVEEWKLLNGIETYKKNLKMQQESAPDGFLHPSLIDGMHKLAEKEAVNSFEAFTLSSQKERSIKAKLLQAIRDINDKFKAKSADMQSSKTDSKLKAACESLRSELSAKLPFTCPENPALNSSMVFYENDVIDKIVKETTIKIRRAFVREFPEAGTERQQSLLAELNAKMQSIVETYTDKNMENRDRGYELAETAVKKLTDEYVAGVKKSMASKQNIDEEMMEAWHEIQADKIQIKFDKMTVGTPEFTQKTWERIQAQVQEEFKKLKLDMTSELSHSDNENFEGSRSSATKPTPKPRPRAKLPQEDTSLEPIIAAILQEYEQKIKTIQQTLRSQNQLSQEHERLKKEAEESLKTNLSKNPELYTAVSEKLGKSLGESFCNVQSTFVEQKEIDDVVLREAKFEASKAYHDDMKSFFEQNRNEYFGDTELFELSKNSISKIMARTDGMFDLNAAQRNAVDQALSDLYKKYKEQNDVIKHTHTTEDLAIGIDLGTTYCCVAVYHRGRVEVLPNDQGDNTTPSYVCIHASGDAEVGSTAKNRSFRNPDSTIFDAKRIIGRHMNDPYLQEDIKFWPFKVIQEDNVPKIQVHNKNYYPQEISGMLLKHLKEEAEKTLNKTINKAVITVPAYFTDGQRQATIDAGEMAGLQVLGILNEPTAAALAFRHKCFHVGTSRKILVYDFGGGTFDVSILSISNNKLEVLGIAGDSHLGGQDLDKKMMEYCAYKFRGETGVDVFDGKDDPNQKKSGKAKRNINRLQIKCEETKKGLSNARLPTSNTPVTIDGFVDGEDLMVDISRQIFDELNHRLYERTIEITDQALKDAGLSTVEIDDVVMVGGSTRIKKVQEMLSEHFGKPLCNRLNPDEAVAYGAAVQAALLNSKPGTRPFDFGKIQEVTSMSYGIEMADKTMDVLIPKGTKIPVSYTEEYKTFKNGQTSVVIPLYQGDEKSTDQNVFLGTFALEGIPPGPAGSESIDVTMKIDMNGTLSVEAVCRSTKGKKGLVVTDDRARMPKEIKNRYLGEATQEQIFNV